MLELHESEINARREKLADICICVDCGEDIEDCAELINSGLTDSDPIVRLLAGFVCSKNTANQCRLAGAIDLAVKLDRSCEKIYSKIPKTFRW